MSVASVVEFFHMLILGDAKDAEKCSAETAWFQMCLQETPLKCSVFIVQEELSHQKPCTNTIDLETI